MPRVIHTGQALVDATATVAMLPERGQNVMADGWGQAAAGAVNILVAAARSGADCVHAGAIGEGPNGDLIRSSLTAEGVTCSAPLVRGMDTALCVVLVEPTGERTFITMQGAERQLSIESLESCHPLAGDLVCVTGYSLAVKQTRDPLLAWLPTLPEGVEVVLDPGAAFASLNVGVRSEMLRLATIWTSNQEEAAALVGETQMAAATLALRSLLSERAAIIVRDGPAGCAVSYEDGRSVVVAGFPQRAIDTNGAGDAHTGVLLAERARGAGWEEACLRANVAGAIKVTRRGPATAPTAAEISAFLAGNDCEGV